MVDIRVLLSTETPSNPTQNIALNGARKQL